MEKQPSMKRQPKRMNKQTKTITIMTLVFLVLVSILYFMKFFAGNMEATETESAEILVDIQKEAIVKLGYDYEGVTYAFEKVDDTWYYAEDHTLQIIQSEMDTMLAGIAPLKSLMLIDDATDMTQYGLSVENRMLTFETADAQYSFELGGQNYVVKASYIRRPQDALVYVVDSAVVSAFDKPLEELVEEAEAAEEAAE